VVSTDLTGAPLPDKPGQAGVPIDTLTELNHLIRSGAGKTLSAYSGWTRNYREVGEVNFTDLGFVNDTVFLSTYKPEAGQGSCASKGVSRVYGWDMLNGLAQLKSKTVNVAKDSSGGQIPLATGSTLIKTSDVMAQEKGTVFYAPTAISESRLVLPDDKGGTDSIDVDMPALSPARRSWREIPMDELN